MNTAKVRAKQWLKVTAIFLVVVVLLVVWAVIRAGKRKKNVQPSDTGLGPIIVGLREEITAANAEAAVAINAAQRQDVELKTNLNEAIKIPDAAQRRKRLIELREGIQ